MIKDIAALEEAKTWNFMVRENLPEGLNIISSTCAFNIKRYPNGRFLKSKTEIIKHIRRHLEETHYKGLVLSLTSYLNLD